jgi:hypothetical protein
VFSSYSIALFASEEDVSLALRPVCTLLYLSGVSTARQRQSAGDGQAEKKTACSASAASLRQVWLRQTAFGRWLPWIFMVSAIALFVLSKALSLPLTDDVVMAKVSVGQGI